MAVRHPNRVGLRYFFSTSGADSLVQKTFHVIGMFLFGRHDADQHMARAGPEKSGRLRAEDPSS
jgi:hypothetical protein